MQQLQEEANNYCSQKTTEQLYYSEQIRILPSKRTAVGSIFHFFLTLPRQKKLFPNKFKLSLVQHGSQ